MGTPVRTYSRKRFMSMLSAGSTSPSTSTSVSPKSKSVSPSSDIGELETSPSSQEFSLSSQENLWDDINDNFNKTFDLPLFYNEIEEEFSKKQAKKEREAQEKKRRRLEQSKRKKRKTRKHDEKVFEFDSDMEANENSNSVEKQKQIPLPFISDSSCEEEDESAWFSSPSKDIFSPSPISKKKTTAKRKRSPSPSPYKPAATRAASKSPKKATTKKRLQLDPKDPPSTSDSPVSEKKDSKKQEKEKKSKTKPKKKPKRKVYRRTKKEHISEDEDETKGKSQLELEDEMEDSELRDDVDYIIEGLKNEKSLQIRRGSAFTLAQACKNQPAQLGLYFRANSMLNQVFELLEKDLDDQLSAMCSAAFIYFLFGDTLNSEYVTSKCTQLLLKMASMKTEELKSDTCTTIMKSKLDRLFEGLVSDVSTPAIAIQALSNLSSISQNRDNIKDSLRTLGILDTTKSNIMELVKELLISKQERNDNEGKSEIIMKELGHYMRLIEHSTFVHSVNQQHLSSDDLIKSLTQLFHYCTQIDVKTQPVAEIECLMGCLKVLINMTNENETGSQSAGRAGAVVQCIELLLEVSEYPEQYRFDVHMLGLCLLINLVETSYANRELLRDYKMKKARGRNSGIIPYLCELFLKKAAKTKTRSSKEQSDTESNVLASYLAILLAVMTKDTKSKELILKSMPQKSFTPLIEIIEEFIMFQMGNGILSKEAHQSYSNIVESLKAEDTAAKAKPESN